MKKFINDIISFLLVFLSILSSYFLFFSNLGTYLTSFSGIIIFIIPFYLFLKAININFYFNKNIFNFIISFTFIIFILNIFTIVNFNFSIYNVFPKIIEFIIKVKYYKILFNLFFISIFLLSMSYILEYILIKKLKNQKEKIIDNKKNKSIKLLSYKNPIINKNSDNFQEKVISLKTDNKNKNLVSLDNYNIDNNDNFKNKTDIINNNNSYKVNNNSNSLLIEENIKNQEKTTYNLIDSKNILKNEIESNIFRENGNSNNDLDLNINKEENIKNNSSKNKNEYKSNEIKTLNNNENYLQSVINLLDDIKFGIDEKPDEEEIIKKGGIIEKTLLDFGIKSKLLNFHVGPVVTRFEFLVDEKINLSKIEKIEKNISYNLSAEKIRILAPIPGKKAVGFEVPNDIKEIVRFKDFLKLPEYKSKNYELPLILGKDIDGVPYIVDLTETPHMLIAGRTGSGKSVCINSLINSLILKKSPDELRIILIDPKRVELSLYEELPHLLSQVLVYPDEAALSLKWLVNEMENRYNKLKENKVRNIKDYNKTVTEEEKMPYLVLIIDEFYALIQVAQKTIEDSLIRLSAMARAVGIHLIFATQRPSSDVITGVIKSNLPTRISFQTSSKTDSRIILDVNGAESLLGNGDMLFSFGGLPPVRIQGTYISTPEVKNIVNFVKNLYSNYEKKNIIEEIKNIENTPINENELFDEPLYMEAVEIVKAERRVSASYLQRRLKIGYNRAARIIEKMEEEGLIGPMKGNKERDIFI